MKIAVLGDVGQQQYHVGDEAMAHAAVNELRSRGVSDVVMLTHDTAQTEEIFGTPASLRAEVPWNAFDRHHALTRIKDLAAGRPAHHPDPTRHVFDALSRAFEGCDALVVAGGGNMTSQFGGLLFERLAAIHIAHARGMKVVVLAQTFGPVLTDSDAEDLREALALCDLVAVRERSSGELLAGLGIEAAGALDDATFLTPAPDTAPVPTPGAAADPAGGNEPAGPFIAASFAPWGGAMPQEAYFRLLAGLMDSIAEQTGLPTVLVPHVSTPAANDGDVAAHESIAGLAARASTRVLDQLSAEETAQLTGRAELVLTTRYHPVVFALAAGVPVLPLAVDHYGEVRLGGALENWGLAPALRSIRHLADDGGASWAAGILASAPAVRAHLAAAAPTLREFEREWWDGVVRALHGLEPALPELPRIQPAEDLRLTAAEGPATALLNAGNERAIGHLAQRVDFLEGYVKYLEHQVAEAAAAREAEAERQVMSSRPRIHGLARTAAARLRRRK